MSEKKFPNNEFPLSLTIHGFADIFGVAPGDLPEECRNLILQSDFNYRNVSDIERDHLFLRAVKALFSDLPVAGSHRKTVWEKGWTENYDAFQRSGDPRELVPKFIRGEYIRLNGRYILPSDSGFETAFLEVLRIYLFRKYFLNFGSIYEFGCGTGLSLISLFNLYPEKRIYGLDWAESSVKIIERIADSTKMNLKAYLFDMFKPDYEIPIDNNSAVFTIAAMEQLGKAFGPFLDFLIDKNVGICINIETLYELYDQESLFDYVAAKYSEKRGYLQGYVEKLLQLQDSKKIEILEMRRTFGSFFHEGYGYVIWRPIKKMNAQKPGGNS